MKKTKAKKNKKVGYLKNLMLKIKNKKTFVVEMLSLSYECALVTMKMFQRKTTVGAAGQ